MVLIVRRSKHDRGVEEIVNRLKNSSVKYDDVSTHLSYGHRKSGCEGEMDVIAYYKGNVLIFEFKCNDSYNLRAKAFKQLSKAAKHFKEQNVYTFYAYWHKREVVYEKVASRSLENEGL
ncbi:MAG: hypothetical protein KKB65_00945 [Nanoarchaeota archaeon]|nr:hypothetical protein [Nanoarchaeota archaeon]MBU1029776.1 hypothetical protein [Nanoarchaeota archaeon]MBU1849606.1 hypothetical protein [Nanoarchaeota archaeon]